MRETADLFYWSSLKTHIERVWHNETDPFSSCVRQGHDFTRSFSTLPAHGMEIPLEMKPALTHNSKFCLGVGLWFPKQKYWPFGQHMKYRLCGCDGSSSHLACDYHCRQTYLNWWKHSRAYRWKWVSVWLAEHPNPESALLGRVVVPEEDSIFGRQCSFTAGVSLAGLVAMHATDSALASLSSMQGAGGIWAPRMSVLHGPVPTLLVPPHQVQLKHPHRVAILGGVTRECTQPHSPAYLNNYALCCGFF